MTSLYGVKPEPMPLYHQQCHAALVISQYLQQGATYLYQGPELSPLQLAESLANCRPSGSVKLNAYYDDTRQRLVFDLLEAGKSKPLRSGFWNLSLADMVLLSQGASVKPLTSKQADQLRLQFEEMESLDKPAGATPIS